MNGLLNYFGAILMAFFGVLFIPIGLPLKLRKIKRNQAYGFKMKYTLEDDEIWYEVNALLGRQMFSQGLAFLALSVPCFFFPGKVIQTIIAVSFVFAGVFGCIGFSIITGKKLMDKMSVEKGLKK